MAQPRLRSMADYALALTGPRSVRLVEEEPADLGEDEVRVRTLFSGISTGTELAAYRATSPHLHKHWDPVRRLFVEDRVMTTGPYPLTTWGYEEVGEIVEVGARVRDLPTGTIVYGTWGHRSSAVVAAADARDRVLPAGADPVLGIFSHVGPVALNGILDSGLHLGETAAVFGLGVVGQITAQLALLAGTEVIGVDLVPLRLDIAARCGISLVLDGREGSSAERIKGLTNGRGADVSIEASGSYHALQEATRAVAYGSRVVAIGFFQGEGLGLFLGEEAHHNRVRIVVSQIGGVAPELQHRWDRLRLVQTFMGLAVEGRIELRPLITHIVRPEDAGELFELLDQKGEQALQTVLDFREPSRSGR